jgi:hypothetical protein
MNFECSDAESFTRPLPQEFKTNEIANMNKKENDTLYFDIFISELVFNEKIKITKKKT